MCCSESVHVKQLNKNPCTSKKLQPSSQANKYTCSYSSRVPNYTMVALFNTRNYACTIDDFDHSIFHDFDRLGSTTLPLMRFTQPNLQTYVAAPAAIAVSKPMLTHPAPSLNARVGHSHRSTAKMCATNRAAHADCPPPTRSIAPTAP